MTKKGKKNRWQTFDNPPPIGVWVDVYVEDSNKSWRIDLGEWTGDTLGSINNPWNELESMPLLWRPRHPQPLEPLIERAKQLPVVAIEPDEWVSERSMLYEDAAE